VLRTIPHLRKSAKDGAPAFYPLLMGSDFGMADAKVGLQDLRGEVRLPVRS